MNRIGYFRLQKDAKTGQRFLASQKIRQFNQRVRQLHQHAQSADKVPDFVEVFDDLVELSGAQAAELWFRNATPKDVDLRVVRYWGDAATLSGQHSLRLRLACNDDVLGFFFLSWGNKTDHFHYATSLESVCLQLGELLHPYRHELGNFIRE